MENWLRSNFDSLSDGEVCVFSDANGSIGFDPADPLGMFSSITGTPTYAALSALPCASAGWQAIFDDWKSRGIVS